MGRHKYSTVRPAFGLGEASTPSAKLTEGEGVVETLLGKLSKVAGRKIGKKVAVQFQGDPTPHAEGSDRVAVQARSVNAWEGKEAAGDRIREILEANSLERKKTSPADAGATPPLGRSAARAHAAPQPSASAARAKDLQRALRSSVGENKKVNEVISRLLAEDD